MKLLKYIIFLIVSIQYGCFSFNKYAEDEYTAEDELAYKKMICDNKLRDLGYNYKKGNFKDSIEKAETIFKSDCDMTSEIFSVWALSYSELGDMDNVLYVLDIALNIIKIKSTIDETDSIFINILEDGNNILGQLEEKFASKIKSKKGITFTPYDKGPVPLVPIRPEYPEIAMQAGIEGTIIVQAFIDRRGNVTEAIILKGIPNTGLNEAAIEAVKKTRWKPARQRDKKVGVWMSIPINFKLTTN